MLNPKVEVQMMIRKPITEVFNGFIDPNITTKFWFTKSSGKLEAGKSVTWEWEMYGAKANVNVKQIIPDRLISIEWGEPYTMIDFEFTKLTADTTYIDIRNYGFQQVGEELVKTINDSTGGFTTVVDGLKIYLEHGIEPNFVLDKFVKK